MSILDDLTSKGAEAPKVARTIGSFAVKLDKDKNGKPVFQILASYTDGTPATNYANHWIWLDRGPSGLRAYRDALPAIAKAIDALDAALVKEGTWQPRTGTPAAAQAPEDRLSGTEKRRAAKAAEAAPAAPASAFSDLPF